MSAPIASTSGFSPNDPEAWILVTGGAGFIGSNLVHSLLQADPRHRVVVVDSMTYAGNAQYLTPWLDTPRLALEVANIADADAMTAVFANYAPEQVYHLAAESHVDRSISGPRPFMDSNILGTFVLLECARTLWSGGRTGRFLHVSTDEVFGSLGETGAFTEETPYDPSSPYSASKAASDHLVRAWNRTFGLDVVLTNCSNNFGPRQFPEKLMPVIIRNIRASKPLPVYGDGQNVRDWLYVVDHCEALMAVMAKGQSGRSYNVGGQNEWTNLALVELLCDRVDDALGRPRTSRSLITFVTDRPGHDRRYAIDPTRIRTELGWTPRFGFEDAIGQTVQWYLDHLGPLWGL
jgi:dTDP-glucose 4,6-dehydratase